MISLSHEDFQKSIVKDGGFEVYTQEQFNTWIEDNEEVLQKGESGTLEDFEKSEYETLKEEIMSFSQVEVISPSTESQFRIEKSIVYVRPIQVEWDEPELIKGEDGTEIMKARSGRYTNTPINRKLGRVGQQYGSKKELEEKQEPSSPKPGDKFEYNGETIYVGNDTSGGQNTLTYKAPSVSDKTYWDIDKLKKIIEDKGKPDGDKQPKSRADRFDELVEDSMKEGQSYQRAKETAKRVLAGELGRTDISENVKQSDIGLK